MERVNILPDFINYFLLLFDFIPQPGQLLLVGFPVALHLLLQGLLQTPEPGIRHRSRDTQLPLTQPLGWRENYQIHSGICLPFPAVITKLCVYSSKHLIWFLATDAQQFWLIFLQKLPHENPVLGHKWHWFYTNPLLFSPVYSPRKCMHSSACGRSETQTRELFIHSPAIEIVL